MAVPARNGPGMHRAHPPVHDRPRPGGFDGGVLRPLLGLGALLRRPGWRAMTFELGFALGLSVLLTVYLVYALIRPERF